MAYNIKNLNVASLDFDDIKSSLINFLEQQTDLKNLDYRNEASAVNMLINILATATSYNGVYAQFGFTNSFATTATILDSILGIASNNSVLIVPTGSANVTRTITAGVTLNEYTSFNAKSLGGSDIFFFNIDKVNQNLSASVKLYSGIEVTNFTGYDYDSQSCELPYTIDPNTINFYETDIFTNVQTKWTRVDKTSTTLTGNNTHFTVINGPKGYIVTNNFTSSKTITTSSKVLIRAVLSNGGIGNSATITAPTNITFGTFDSPSGGYDLITLKRAKSALLFKATGQERCVTIRDFKNAIMNSGINGTEDENNIFVKNGLTTGTVNVYVSNLSETEKIALMAYLNERSIAGITLVYSL
jgi:hypothetical protein